MSISIALAGKIVWLLGVIAWYVIRYPFERRAKRVRVVTDRRSLLDKIGLGSAVLGMAVLPTIYVFTGFPEASDYPARWWAVALGAAIFVLALWTFRRSHKELGRNWSITLEIRDQHRLISSGPYALVRHPMYTSFFLIALGQLFVLPNWFAGPIGLLGFAVLFFVRVAKEERMMLEAFGPQYSTYMERTKRLIPYVY